jgi:hypothetical protein
MGRPFNQYIRELIMEEYSDCCGASRHHIFSDLCADCLEHYVECTDFDENGFTV